MKILLVDDDDDYREATSIALRIRGHELREASNGAEAVAAATSAPPDVVLLDAAMPGLSGSETLLALRQGATTAQVPVIFVTAAVRTAYEEHLQSLRSAGILGKPIDILELNRQLDRVVERASIAPHDLAAEEDARRRALRLRSNEKIHEGERLAGTIEASPGARVSLETLWHVFHGFAAVAATLDAPQVAAIGRAGEQSCIKAACRTGPPRPVDIENLRQLLAELRRAVGVPE